MSPIIIINSSTVFKLNTYPYTPERDKRFQNNEIFMSDLKSQLTQLSKTAHPDLLEQIYNATKLRLFAVCLRILKSQQLAEDCLHDSFIKVWKKAHTYNADKSDAITWLSRIVRNQAIDTLRRSERLSYTDEVPEMIDPNASQEQQLQTLQMDAQLNTCLAKLKSEQRLCLMASYFGGQTAQQIAEAMNRPIGTVKTWMARSLPILRSCIENLNEKR